MFKGTDNGRTCFNRCGECLSRNKDLDFEIMKHLWCEFKGEPIYENSDTSECEGFKPKGEKGC
jgi:hypothetical protein